MVERVSSFLPDTVLTNEHLALLFPGWTAEKIFEKTGIRERRVVENGQCASDLAFGAAEALLGSENRAIDWLLFCTQSPDHLLPTTACILQNRLRLPSTCAALDFNMGCSGYIYGLSLADSLLMSGAAQTVLFLTGDTYSRLIHPLDKSTRTIFGDAGTATLLKRGSKSRLHSFVLGSDGSGAQELIVKTGGARSPDKEAVATLVDDSGNIRDSNFLYMNGPEIFNFTLKAVPKLVASILSRAGLAWSEIDLVVFHQANAYMLEHLRRKLAIPADKFVVHLEYCGNTVSSTIPLTLSHLRDVGRLRPGMRLLLAGFGVGYSWGGCILEWN